MYTDGTRHDKTKAKPGENIAVVSLYGYVEFAIIFYSRKRASTCKDCTTLFPLVSLFSSTFRL
nr:hypothetical protein Iba_chr02dCG13440 [Ipomoea batatas]GMC66803.1 hypothetical protein Iba_scaffold32869CG0050 [Ipomoea batatas]GME03433.1 hypothetical protein Iba_scaffold686CG0760 [Ipomoea batatas]